MSSFYFSLINMGNLAPDGAELAPRSNIDLAPVDSSDANEIHVNKANYKQKWLKSSVDSSVFGFIEMFFCGVDVGCSRF